MHQELQIFRKQNRLKIYFQFREFQILHQLRTFSGMDNGRGSWIIFWHMNGANRAIIQTARSI